MASYIAFVDNIDPIQTLYSIRDNGGLSEGLTIAINEQITRLEFDFLNNIHSIVYSITNILLKNVTNSYLLAYFLLMSANFYLLIVFYLQGCIRDIAIQYALEYLWKALAEAFNSGSFELIFEIIYTLIYLYGYILHNPTEAIAIAD